MTRKVEIHPSVQVIQLPSDRSWLKFGHQRGRLAGLFAAAAACLFSGIGAQAFPPTIQQLDPSSAQAGSPGITLTIFGFQFDPLCTPIEVLWDGVSLGTPTFCGT